MQNYTDKSQVINLKAAKLKYEFHAATIGFRKYNGTQIKNGY